MLYKFFNTGDQLWYDDNGRVVKLLTSDGLSWTKGDVRPLTKLSGLEKINHYLMVLFTRLYRMF